MNPDEFRAAMTDLRKTFDVERRSIVRAYEKDGGSDTLELLQRRRNQYLRDGLRLIIRQALSAGFEAGCREFLDGLDEN